MCAAQKEWQHAEQREDNPVSPVSNTASRFPISLLLGFRATMKEPHPAVMPMQIQEPPHASFAVDESCDARQNHERRLYCEQPANHAKKHSQVDVSMMTKKAII